MSIQNHSRSALGSTRDHPRFDRITKREEGPTFVGPSIVVNQSSGSVSNWSVIGLYLAVLDVLEKRQDFFLQLARDPGIPVVEVGEANAIVLQVPDERTGSP
jgi:hypothetical protein